MLYGEEGPRSTNCEPRGAILKAAAERDTSGGALYDTVIVAAAVQARATVILTWNTDDFLRLAPPDIEVVAPGSTDEPMYDQ